MKILILANHYNTLRIFRRELLQKLSSLGHELVVSIPPCDDENRDTLASYGCRVVFTGEMARRGMNPVQDLALLRAYRQLIKAEVPDKIITYTIKCNIYGAYAAKQAGIPCYANVTGLGSAFQGNGMMRRLVSVMYKHSMDRWNLYSCDPGKPAHAGRRRIYVCLLRAYHFYDPDSHLGKELPHDPGVDIPVPQMFAQMKQIAADLSKPFSFVRVDLYQVGGQVYFGELTFFPAGGAPDFVPAEYDRIVGDMWNISETQL